MDEKRSSAQGVLQAILLSELPQQYSVCSSTTIASQCVSAKVFMLAAV